MFKVNEIKQWAKKQGITIKKQGEGYVWFKDEARCDVPKDISEAVKDIYNHMTDNKYLEYQKNYSPEKIQLSTD